MKLTLLTGIIITLTSTIVLGQNTECKKFKNGYFKIKKDSIAEESFIARNEHTQTEIINGKYIASEFHVEWINDCLYTLTPTKKTLLQFVGLPKDAILTVEIIEAKENSYIQKSTANFADFEIITEAIKIDSIEFEKHKKANSTNDSIKGQIKTAEKFKNYMNAKNYEDAISLFSMKQQENIREIQKDNEMFKYWCLVWTFDEAKYERYITSIKTGQAHFIFENNEWRINEK
jgi:hypothetical protein